MFVKIPSYIKESILHMDWVGARYKHFPTICYVRFFYVHILSLSLHRELYLSNQTHFQQKPCLLTCLLVEYPSISPKSS